MRDHSKHIQLTREDAVEAMLAHSEFDPATETISITQAYGRVLAHDIVSEVEFPAVPHAAMDSIAVHWSDFKDLADGELPDTSTWVRGTDWQFANTGVAMPEGFDTCIVIEHVSVSPDEQHVTIDAAPSKQCAGTRPVASELAKGDLLGAAYSVLGPDLLARIARGNISQVDVLAKPKVAFIPTGNELVPAGTQPLPRGKNIETNSILIEGKILAWGGEPVMYDIVPDKPELIESTILDACDKADIVVLNAGSSKGSDDWSCEKLEDMGEVFCHQTNHGPGHHSSYALVNGTPIVGISGPPMGASFTTDFYLKPVMMKYLKQPTGIKRVKVRLESEFPVSKHGPAALKPGDKVAGEMRPPEGFDGGARNASDAAAAKPAALPMYGIKFVKVAQDNDGTLVATPVSAKPGTVAVNPSNAIYMMPNGPDAVPPSAGDIIEVEMTD
ncbi:MAG: molybdopterin molybdotransferase MoeA [Coriobacteriales bacterium]|jgi:molybdopterin molybdotransferase|nr:molybdopterin molybdotransferase MoeA [Coriobacteriales bacterium]